jgi:hypothetical protein
MKPRHLRPHWHHMHANGDGTATCCHCKYTEPIPAGVTPEATYQPRICGPFWTPPLVATPDSPAGKLAALVGYELRESVPVSEPTRYQPSTEDEREFEAYRRWADTRPADDVQFEVR